MTLRLVGTVTILTSTILTAALATVEVQTFTAPHTYILGDHDSKDDARQRCLLEAKHKILEQAGVYIESASEVKGFQLTKDKITSFAAAVMQVKDTKEEVGFENGHMTIALTIKADVDLAEVRKQLAARQVDKGVRDEVAQQKERLERLEAQLEAMQKQQQGAQSSVQTPAPLPSDILATDLQKLKTRAAQGDAMAQTEIGHRYALGNAVPQDYTQAAYWYEKAAVQGNASAQSNLSALYSMGKGVPQDYTKAQQWIERAAAQGYAPAQDSLGLRYEVGERVPKDYAKARQWYVKAAAQGNARAQNHLGMLYLLGHGVPMDLVQSYMWFNLAAANSVNVMQKTSVDVRDRIARDMTPAQLAEAQRLVQEWTEAFEKRQAKK